MNEGAVCLLPACLHRLHSLLRLRTSEGSVLAVGDGAFPSPEAAQQALER